jgi:DNA-binding FrmR family transcriptional regulator
MAKLCEKCVNLYIEKDLESVVMRLKRIKGQIEGIMRMLEQGRTCIEVLSQINSVIEASKGVRREIMEKYLRVCIKYAIINKREEIYEEVMKVFDRYFK